MLEGSVLEVLCDPEHNGLWRDDVLECMEPEIDAVNVDSTDAVRSSRGSKLAVHRGKREKVDLDFTAG
jgi:hypothetical protein